MYIHIYVHIYIHIYIYTHPNWERTAGAARASHGSVDTHESANRARLRRLEEAESAENENEWVTEEEWTSEEEGVGGLLQAFAGLSTNERKQERCNPKSVDPGEECPICYGVMLTCDGPSGGGRGKGGGGEKLVYCRSQCGKYFHADCMDKWTAESPHGQKCPMCRAPWCGARCVDAI